MQEVYQDIMLDGHLTGITENRTLRTTNKDYIFTVDIFNEGIDIPSINTVLFLRPTNSPIKISFNN